jgi:hypothetical protein
MGATDGTSVCVVGASEGERVGSIVSDNGLGREVGLSETVAPIRFQSSSKCASQQS